MAFPTAEVLTNRVAPLAASHGLDVEHVKATPAGKKSQVIIRLDGDKRPTSDLLEVLSEEISALFDDLESRGELNFGAGYTLEVSTPGVDLPLTLPRHFRRNRGRLIKLGDQLMRLGALSEDEDEIVVLPTPGAGSKNKALKEEVRVERLVNLAGAVVEIEFAKPSERQLELVELSFDHAAELAHRED